MQSPAQDPLHSIQAVLLDPDPKEDDAEDLWGLAPALAMMPMRQMKTYDVFGFFHFVKCNVRDKAYQK